MQKRTAILTTAVPYANLPIGGKQWKLGRISDKSAKIDVTWFNAVGGEIAQWTAIEQRATYNPPEGFAAFLIKADKPVNVEYYITDGAGSFDVDIDLTGQKIEVTNTQANPLFVATPPGQRLNIAIPQPNGCDDALKVKVCPPEPVEHRTRNERSNAQNTTVQWRAFDPARQYWLMRNVHPVDVWLAIGGDNLDDDNAGRVLRPSEYWYEDNPLIAQQPIFIRTVPNAAGGGFPNGQDCLFTYEERT